MLLTHETPICNVGHGMDVGLVRTGSGLLLSRLSTETPGLRALEDGPNWLTCGRRFTPPQLGRPRMKENVA